MVIGGYLIGEGSRSTIVRIAAPRRERRGRSPVRRRRRHRVQRRDPRRRSHEVEDAAHRHLSVRSRAEAAARQGRVGSARARRSGRVRRVDRGRQRAAPRLPRSARRQGSVRRSSANSSDQHSRARSRLRSSGRLRANCRRIVVPTLESGAKSRPGSSQHRTNTSRTAWRCGSHRSPGRRCVRRTCGCARQPSWPAPPSSPVQPSSSRRPPAGRWWTGASTAHPWRRGDSPRAQRRGR